MTKPMPLHLSKIERWRTNAALNVLAMSFHDTRFRERSLHFIDYIEIQSTIRCVFYVLKINSSAFKL